MRKALIQHSALMEYCRIATVTSKQRAGVAGLPYALEKTTLADLMVDQEWCCAITGVPLEPRTRGTPLLPFGPSLDRIVPNLGYVPGNVRIVCNIVNYAMNQWGFDALSEAERRKNRIRRKLAKRRPLTQNVVS